MKWILPPSVVDTFGNFRPLSLTSSACVKSSCLLTISTNRRYHKCLYTYSCHLSGVLSVTFDHYHWVLRLASIFIKTSTITSNARYRQLVNTIMLMNALAILRSTFGNFRPLSLTTSACVNLHILNFPLLRKRAMVNAAMPLQIAFSEMNTLPIFRGYS